MSAHEQVEDTVGFAFRTDDGAEFAVATVGPSLEDVVSIEWRGIEICIDCFLAALRTEEREVLLLQIRGDVRDA